MGHALAANTCLYRLGQQLGRDILPTAAMLTSLALGMLLVATLIRPAERPLHDHRGAELAFNAEQPQSLQQLP